MAVFVQLVHGVVAHGSVYSIECEMDDGESMSYEYEIENGDSSRLWAYVVVLAELVDLL